MGIKDLIREMVERNGSDLFFRAGGTPRIRIDGKIMTFSDKVLTVDDVVRATDEITTPRQREIFKNNFDVDLALYLEEFGHRFRVSIFMQRNWPSIVIRNVRSDVLTFGAKPARRSPEEIIHGIKGPGPYDREHGQREIYHHRQYGGICK